MAGTILELCEVGFTFRNGRHPQPVLEEISFGLKLAESLAIMGESGVGKTTLCRLMAGLISPTSGSVFFDEQPLSQPSSSITISFQNYPCFPWLTVERNVLFGREVNGSRKSVADSEYAMWLLDQVGLTPVRKAYPRELSGGMLQRLSIARSLAVHPKVLILDEPFSALDPKTKADLKNLILSLQDKAHFSLIVILHNLEDAYSLTDRVVVLDGKPARISLTAAIEGLEFAQFEERILAAMTTQDMPAPCRDVKRTPSSIQIDDAKVSSPMSND